ncbi:hypothetical protein KI387_029576, partial [Taxus chinensis]
VMVVSVGGGRFTCRVVMAASVVIVGMHSGNEGAEGGGISMAIVGPEERGEISKKMLAMADESGFEICDEQDWERW